MPPWLIVLLAVSFVLYTDDYVIAGILPEIATDLGVTEGQAGQLVTAFSATVAVAAPVAAVALARVPPRRLFLVALIIFAGANLGAVVASSFGVLMVLRMVAAAAAASVTPAIFAFAASHAPAGKTGRYLATVSLGVTGSIALGVPLGTWIGGAFGWRATFLAVAVAGMLALIGVLLTVPGGGRGDRSPRLSEQLRSLTRAPIAVSLAANCLLMAGTMMVLTYLAPYLSATAGAGVEERGVAFGLSGFAGMAGIWLGGQVADRWGPGRALFFGIGVIIAAMVAMWAMWAFRPVPIWLVLIVTTVWGGMAFWNSPAIQMRLHTLAGPLAGQALALNASGTYLGIAFGAAVGGVVLTEAGPGILPLAAAGFGLAALILLELVRRSPPAGRTRNSDETPPVGEPSHGSKSSNHGNESHQRNSSRHTENTGE